MYMDIFSTYKICICVMYILARAVLNANTKKIEFDQFKLLARLAFNITTESGQKFELAKFKLVYFCSIFGIYGCNNV